MNLLRYISKVIFILLLQLFYSCNTIVPDYNLIIHDNVNKVLSGDIHYQAYIDSCIKGNWLHQTVHEEHFTYKAFYREPLFEYIIEGISNGYSEKQIEKRIKSFQMDSINEVYFNFNIESNGQLVSDSILNIFYEERFKNSFKLYKRV